MACYCLLECTEFCTPHPVPILVPIDDGEVLSLSSVDSSSSLLSEWIGCLGLNVDDQKRLGSSAWLTANHISASSKLLKIQFPNQNGLQEISYLIEKSIWESHPKDFVQIIHIDGHWACVSDVFCTDEETCTVDLFDSAHTEPSVDGSIVKQVATILRPKQHFVINLINVSLQFGGSDCGLFAIAMATDLVHRIDPFSVKYKQQLMRNHLIKCFQRLKVSSFPSQARAASLRRILCTYRVSVGDKVTISKGLLHVHVSVICASLYSMQFIFCARNRCPTVKGRVVQVVCT